MSSSEKVTSTLQSILADQTEDRIFINPNIPAKKLSNAIKSYSEECNPENVLLLYDDTVFKSGKTGLILTSTHLSFKCVGTDAMHIACSDIDSVKFKKGLLNSSILVNDKTILNAVQISKDGAGALAESLNTAITELTEKPHLSTEKDPAYEATELNEKVDNKDPSEHEEYTEEECVEYKRIGRASYIWRSLLSIACLALAYGYNWIYSMANKAGAIGGAAGIDGSSGWTDGAPHGLLVLIPAVLIFLPLLVTAIVRRMRDIGLSLFLLLTIFFPPIFGIMMLLLALLKANTFGKEESELLNDLLVVGGGGTNALILTEIEKQNKNKGYK